jgi:HAD superfamily hydrolase (TIGR01509 family)
MTVQPLEPSSAVPVARRPLRAIIFDVDGTLAETEELHRRAFNEAFVGAGLEWYWDRDLYRELLKVTGGKERIRHFIKHHRPKPVVHPSGLVDDLHRRKTAVYTARVTAGDIQFRPGMAELILDARRRGLVIAIATTTSRPNVDALLTARFGRESIGWFATIATGDTVRRKKPAPDLYLAVLAALGIEAAEAVAVEDSWNGVRAARSAGLPVVAVPSLYSAADDFSEATLVLQDSREVERLVDWPFGPA